MTINWTSELALPLAMAVAAGLVGCFAVVRRMTLASDAISHVALPGIGIALALKLNPVLGGLAALLLGTLLVWALEYKTRLPTESVIGVVFSAALAVGSMLTSGEDLIDALFGAPKAIGTTETLLGVGAAIWVAIFVLRARSRLVITLLSPDMARTAGIDVPGLNLLYLTAFAITVALGLRYLGVLLMGSLIIIPATTARYLSRNLNSMLVIGVVLAVASTFLGELAGRLLHREAGPLIISVAAGFFVLALLKRRED
jgi:ABC-type Mn2+/Zn2+ transport system permease subunit